MTILVTELGPNSAALNYSTKTTRFDILEAVINWFTQHGWTMHDDFANGDTDVSPYKVLKAVQKDAAYPGDSISSITVSGGTYVYAEAPAVNIAAPDQEGGTQATATAVLDGDGLVTSVTIDEPGSGYSSAPVVSIVNFDGTATALLVQNTNEKFVRVVVTDANVFTEVYEDWDEVAHTGTNKAYQSDLASLAQQLTLPYGGYLYMFATNRWLVVQSKTNDSDLGDTTHGGFCGCLEISRDNPDETVGDAPLFSFSTAWHIDGYSANNTSYRDRLWCVPLPRDPFGSVGSSASIYTFVTTLFGCTHNMDHRLIHFIPVAADPIGSNEEYFVMSLFTGHSGNGEPEKRHIRGRYYGIKMLTRYIGAFMDKIQVPVDGNSMYDPNGTPTDHFILTDDVGARFAIPA